ncbi:hypothetical protein K469DRAFT_718067 [Zopfia rhizophila CBS 207.26]|uniref:Uncharacterized protein n=1 Tax=Zopfia rhizophila CBS 207.26 TaxID=1314779 RepID=A0A6A6DJD4_9PEZI|nr:hypothetical protein K469DRAFT_718067 [Zopfia rhizophila CBS 207.26]
MARANAPIVTNPFTKNQDHRLQRDSTRGGWVSIEVSKARKALPTNAAGPPSRPNSPLQRLAETSHAHNHYAETIDSSEADFPGPDTNDRASSYKLQPTSYEKDVYYAIGPANHPLPPIDDSTYEPSLSSPLLSSDSLRRNSPVSAIIALPLFLASRIHPRELRKN